MMVKFRRDKKLQMQRNKLKESEELKSWVSFRLLLVWILEQVFEGFS